MAQAMEFKYQGKRYVLDSIALLRLVQKMMTDTTAVFSRGDKAALSEMLNPLIHKIGSIEDQYEKDECARQQDEEKDTEEKYKIPRILFDVSIHQNELPDLLQKLRRSEPFPIDEIVPGYDNVTVTVDSHVTVLFNDTETVHVRVLLKGDVLPKTVIQGSA